MTTALFCACTSILPLPATNNTVPSSSSLSGSFQVNQLPVPPLFTGIIRKGNRRHQMKGLFTCLSAKASESTIRTARKNPGKDRGKLILSEGRDGDESYGPICPGCGVFMQDKDPNLPGYYQKRKVEVKQFLEAIEGGFEGIDEELERVPDEIDGKVEVDGEVEESDAEVGNLKNEGFDWDIEGWESDFEDDDSDLKQLDGFCAAGVGYGNITEEAVNKEEEKKMSTAEKKRLSREVRRDKAEVTVCARCHSLRNYGQVKNRMAENLVPDFDFDRLVTTRLIKPTGSSGATVVVMVVDCVDFDGSFPRRGAESFFKALEGSRDGQRLNKKLPKLVLVGTKVDLLPSQVSPTRLDRWVRHRAKAGGVAKLSGLYLVSAHKDLGVRNLLSYIKELTGPRGNVWVIGAQNAGKSTLINAFAKKEGVEVVKLTEAAIPGTTLGILRIGGILSAKAKLYDTPGLLHPYLMSMRLNREEQKLIEIRKELRPRTYRIKPGQTVHVGALMRLDLNQASVQTIYVTIWASPNVSLHMGKTENADDIFGKHAGVRLQPPIGAERLSELGKWKGREIKVSGTSWDVNSMDIAVAGLGWFSLGLKGEATLRLWVYEGVEVTLREPLILDRAPFLERPGFWLPRAISDAIGSQTKADAQERGRKPRM